MSAVNITNVAVLDNPAPFLTPFQFEISYECLTPLKDGTSSTYSYPTISFGFWSAFRCFVFTCCFNLSLFELLMPMPLILCLGRLGYGEMRGKKKNNYLFVPVRYLPFLNLAFSRKKWALGFYYWLHVYSKEMVLAILSEMSYYACQYLMEHGF